MLITKIFILTTQGMFYGELVFQDLDYLFCVSILSMLELTTYEMVVRILEEKN